MTNPILFAIAGVMLAATAPVQAGTPDSPGGTASAGSVATTAKPIPGPNTKYCVVEESTGSRIPHKVCLTRERWLARGFDPTEKR